MNSQFKGNVLAIRNYEGNIQLAGSKIEGTIQSSNAMKIVNCFDGAFNPIPNQ